MNSTKIEWCTRTWNPVTGCRHGCEYCYARRIAERFRPFDLPHVTEDGAINKINDLAAPIVTECKDGKERICAHPYGFEPTFHRYRLHEPVMELDPQTIFVVSMGDLFGDWVPTSWIRDVFDACLAAPWHTYMFLTKNPHRYARLDEMAFLPHGSNFWYGTTVTGRIDKTVDNDIYMMDLRDSGVHTFWSVEPMMGPISDMLLWLQHPDLIIVGAETGNRKNKVVPERSWVEELREACVELRIPVIWKDNIRKLYPDLPKSAPMPGKEGE